MQRMAAEWASDSEMFMRGICERKQHPEIIPGAAVRHDDASTELGERIEIAPPELPSDTVRTPETVPRVM